MRVCVCVCVCVCIDGADAAEGAEQISSVFVKNLNFSTNNETLMRVSESHLVVHRHCSTSAVAHKARCTISLLRRD